MIKANGSWLRWFAVRYGQIKCEFKSDIEKFGHEIKQLRHSLSWTQEDAAWLKDSTETNAELEALQRKIANQELWLNEERENNIKLEQI